jgi:hypothetical protein
MKEKSVEKPIALVYGPMPPEDIIDEPIADVYGPMPPEDRKAIDNPIPCVDVPIPCVYGPMPSEDSTWSKVKAILSHIFRKK